MLIHQTVKYYNSKIIIQYINNILYINKTWNGILHLLRCNSNYNLSYIEAEKCMNKYPVYPYNIFPAHLNGHDNKKLIIFFFDYIYIYNTYYYYLKYE